MTRTLIVTAACGLGHVASSIVLGGLGVVFGVAVARIEGVEGGRGDLAAWALVAFGIAYAVWGLRQALRKKKGIETHEHHGHIHLHSHGNAAHSHEHGMGSNLTIWKGCKAVGPNNASGNYLYYGVTIEPPADAQSGDPGTTVTYTLRVTNTGNVDINNVVLTDDLAGAATLVSGDTDNAAFRDLLEQRRDRRAKFFHRKPPEVLDVCQVPMAGRVTR